MKKNFICNFILSGLLLLSPLSIVCTACGIQTCRGRYVMVESEMIRCPEFLAVGLSA